MKVDTKQNQQQSFKREEILYKANIFTIYIMYKYKHFNRKWGGGTVINPFNLP